VRRNLLLTVVVTALAGLAAVGSATPASTACRPTLSQGGGPFEMNNTPAPRRARIGSGHVLSGKILRYPGCAPITGRTGVFRFEGPVPPGEFGRPPHIHVRVTAAGYEEFVTTFFVPRGERFGRLTIVLVSAL
jgi:hypothetical protein